MTIEDTPEDAAVTVRVEGVDLRRIDGDLEKIRRIGEMDDNPFQSKTLDNFAPRGLSVFNQDVQTLDLRSEYYIDSARKYRVYFEASDLLKGTQTPDVQQLIAGYYTRATYLGGRKFKIGAAAIFSIRRALFNWYGSSVMTICWRPPTLSMSSMVERARM